MRMLSRRIAGVLIVLSAFVFWSTSPLRAQGAALAIKGYDPVAYFTLGKPIRGLPEFTAEWDEQRYEFSSAAHREIFKADPLRYAPHFANFCAMALTRGEIEEANPEYWLISDGKLYVFGKPIGPTLFQQAHTEKLEKANENRWLIQKR